MSSQILPFSTFPLKPGWKSPFSSVHKTLFYNFFGRVSTFQSDISSASEFAAEYATMDRAYLESVLSEFISSTHGDCVGDATQKQSCHITLWLWQYKPEGFGKPTWHRDGPLYPLQVGSMPFPRSKYAVTLLGQPTEILVNTTNVIDAATKASEDDLRYDELVRHFEAAGFDSTDREEVKTGQVVRFTWGENDSPVHREPVITEDRVFMSVIYGTEQEILSLAEWRDEKYHSDE